MERGSGLLLWWQRESFPKAGRVCSQWEERLDLDTMLADAIKHAIGKAANQRAADIRHDRRERFGMLKDAVNGLFDAKHEIIAKARPDAGVPVYRLGQIILGGCRENQCSGHSRRGRRRLTSCHEE